MRHNLQLSDIPTFKFVCMQFYFEEKSESWHFADTLIFTTRTEIFRFNYIKKTTETLYEFKQPLPQYPLYFSIGPK